MCGQCAFAYFWGRFAIRTRLVLRPAFSIRTMDTSPLVCLYSTVTCVVWRMSCAYCISTNLTKTWRRGPSICIIVTVGSAARKTSWIQLWISKADIRVLWWSKLHTSVSSFFHVCSHYRSAVLLFTSLYGSATPLQTLILLTHSAPGKETTFSFDVRQQNGFDPRTVQAEVSRYTDWATRPTLDTHYTN